MEFSGIAKDTAKNVATTIDYILGLPISIADKRARIAKVIRVVGEPFFLQVFEANAMVFGSEAISTLGIIDTSQAGRLSTKLVRNYALGREVSPLIAEYYNSLLGQAQIESFDNARSMQKNPRMTRMLIGEKDCDWCQDKAAKSPYTNPVGEDFARHKLCDCLIEVFGYNTRNGILTNYVKGKG